jgi:signal transduction histidine kinase
MSLTQKLSEALQAVPVFVKVMGIALGMAVLLGVGMLWQIHQAWHGIALRNLDRRGQAMAKDLSVRAAPLMHDANRTTLQHLVEQVRDGVSEVQYLAVLDAHSNLLARSTVAEPQGVVREVAVPIAGGGEARVGVSENHVAYEVGWLTRRLARVTAVIAAFGVLAAWWLTRVFSRPIGELVATTRAVQHGDFGTRAPVRARDEVGELAVAFNDMTAALQQKEVMRQRLLRRAMEVAEDERKRLARELHDQTGQSLASLIAGLAALEPCAPDAACATKLLELRNLASQTLSDVHAVSVALRPSVLDDVGLAAALEKHCQAFAQRFGVQVESEAVGLDGARLPVEIETALYRVVQEALTNAVRHGAAKTVHVLLQRKDSSALVVVEDDGHGFDAVDWRAHCLRGDHLGLLGIEERAGLIGGTLQIESQPGKGTSLFVEVPCPKSAF